MQTIEQFLSTIAKLHAAAKAAPDLSLHLTAKDEQALLIHLWKTNLAGPVPDPRQVFKTLAGYPVVWGAKTTAIQGAAKAAAPKAAPKVAAPKAPAKTPAPKVEPPKVGGIMTKKAK